jgi:dihydroorotase
MSEFDLLISGGTLIDPEVGLHVRSDVAFSDGLVAAVAPDIARERAETVVDATGRWVVPGLVDAHVHVFEGVSHYGINPDATCLAHGATTVIDAGSAGANTFAGFRKYVIEASETRILAHMNISAMGMISREIGELDDIKWASVPKALEAIEQHRDLVLGVKVRLTREALVGKAAGLKPLFLAREAADAAGLPIMVHPQNSWAESIDQVVEVMRKGDVLTHMYHSDPHGILDETGRIRDSIRRAHERGVIFDVGHGEGSFDWTVAETALAQDFAPTTISSDLHHYNVNGPVFDLVTTVTKFLHLGMPIDDAIARVTTVPAGVAGLSEKAGTLKVGAFADAVILNPQSGPIDLIDSRRVTRVGDIRLFPECVIKGGRVVARDLAMH